MTARRNLPRTRRATKVGREQRDQRDQRDQGESAFTSILGALVARVPGAQAAAMVDHEGETVDYAGAGDPFGLRVMAAHWRIVFQQADVQSSLRGLHWLVVRGARRSFLVHSLPRDYALIITFTRAAGFAGWQRAVATCARALCQEAGWGSLENWVSAVAATAAPPGPGRYGAKLGWFPIDVIADERRRPQSVRVGGRLHAVEILGTIMEQPQQPQQPQQGNGTSGAAGTARAERVPGIAASGRHKRGRRGPGQLPRQKAGQSAARGGVRGERAWRVRMGEGVEATVVREPGGIWYADEPVDLLVPRR
jgi:hypothetical protein